MLVTILILFDAYIRIRVLFYASFPILNFILVSKLVEGRGLLLVLVLALVDVPPEALQPADLCAATGRFNTYML